MSQIEISDKFHVMVSIPIDYKIGSPEHKNEIGTLRDIVGGIKFDHGWGCGEEDFWFMVDTFRQTQRIKNRIIKHRPHWKVKIREQ